MKNLRLRAARAAKGLSQQGLADLAGVSRQTINAISAIRRFDTRSKGIGSRANEYDLLRELLFAIFN